MLKCRLSFKSPKKYISTKMIQQRWLKAAKNMYGKKNLSKKNLFSIQKCNTGSKWAAPLVGNAMEIVICGRPIYKFNYCQFNLYEFWQNPRFFLSTNKCWIIHEQILENCGQSALCRWTMIWDLGNGLRDFWGWGKGNWDKREKLNKSLREQLKLD